MFYIEVLPASNKFHGREPLTYQSEVDLPIGSVVRVPIRRGSALGIVASKVDKPAFATKPLSQVFDLPPLPPQLIDLARWLADFYFSALGPVAQLLLPKSLLKKPELTPQKSTKQQKKIPLPKLTSEQTAVLKAMNKAGTYLLHGETGSGKTRVYLELAAQALAKGDSAIILTPEIGLTSQLAASFEVAFPGHVVVVHSNLSDKARRQLWQQCLQATKPLVVVGPRSALFSPLMGVGLIVIDECHDSAYKQEQQPYYHAIRVASQLSQLHEALLVLGSATPPVEDYFMAESKKVPILRMQHLARQSATGEIQIQVIDLKAREHFTRQAHLSDELLAAMEVSLQAGEQSLLFLNRRGSARIVLCQVCGWQALCPNCDLPLAYHADTQNLRCHTCGHRQPLIFSCPVCGSTELSFQTIGTKALVDEVRRAFPQARVQRFDTDTNRLERFEQHYPAIAKGEVDILVGTQLLTKGLDLPKLSVVGVICADTSLYLPDFTAQERTYQLLYQVIGRIGRGHPLASGANQAIIQTYQPDNQVLQAALAKDWPTFYGLELRERETFVFPPFCSLLKMTTRRASRAAAQKAADEVAQTLKAARLKVQIIGPSPSFHEKVAGKFQWQLVAKARRRSELLKLIPLLPANWTYDLDPSDLL